MKKTLLVNISRTMLLFGTLFFLNTFVYGQSLGTVYQTTITDANGWTTNTSTGTSATLTYSQNNCVIGGATGMTINTGTTRCTTYTGEIGLANNNGWLDLPAIAFTNNSGATSAGVLSVTWFNSGGGRKLRYYIVNSQGLLIGTAGTIIETSPSGSGSGVCTTYDFILPAITGSQVLKIATNGTASILSVTVQTYSGVTGIVNSDFNSGISIYPNPASKQVTIESNGQDLSGAKVKISNAHGAVVLESEYTNDLNVSKLEPGIYTLMITQSDKTAVKKLVIE